MRIPKGGPFCRRLGVIIAARAAMLLMRKSARLSARTSPASAPLSASFSVGARRSASTKIVYTHTDEAPALATYAFLPVINHMTKWAGIEVERADISVRAPRISRAGLAFGRPFRLRATRGCERRLAAQGSSLTESCVATARAGGQPDPGPVRGQDAGRQAGAGHAG
jgi:hypothetical protein